MMKSPSLTVGIEEEYQVIDPDTRELLGYITQSMARERMVVNERAATKELSELVGSGSISVGTPVCADINEAREKLLGVRYQMLELANAAGDLIAGGAALLAHEVNDLPGPVAAR